MSGKVHQDCPNKNNPFHECNDRCFERISSGDVVVPKKKPFSFGMLARRKETPPSSPARVIVENKSPFSSSYAKRVVVESEESPSFSSSDDTFGENLFKQRSPRQHGNKADYGNYWLPMSPSLSDYCKKDYLASRFDHREGETPIHDGVESEKPPKTRPNTPDHPLRTPLHKPKTPEHKSSTTSNNIALETKPRTPKREFIALEPSPRPPDTRPRTPERRDKSPEYNAISPRSHSKVVEPHAGNPEPHRPMIPQTKPISHRSLDNASPKSPRAVETQPVSHISLDNDPNHRSPRKDETRHHTPKTKAKTLGSMPKAEEYQARSPNHMKRNTRLESRIPQAQPTYHYVAQRSPQASKYHSSKTNSVYTEDEEEECVILDPDSLLSPQKSPSSSSITPKKHQEFDQLDEPESIDISDNFSYLDDHDDDSVYLFPEIATPLHPKSRKPSDKQSYEQPEIENMKALKIYETEEETQSMISESYDSTGSYKVKASISETLKQIWDKHGDITSSCKLQSLITRSNALEMLAFVVLELQSTTLKELKGTRVLEMIAIVEDVESVKIRAGWLREVLNEILDATKVYDRHKTTVMEKEVCERDTLLERREMENVMKEVRLKEKEVKEFRKGVVETAARLGELEMKRVRLEKRLAVLSSKVDKFVGKSVLENVL